MRKYHFLLCEGHYVHSSLKHSIITNEKMIKVKKYFFSFRKQIIYPTEIENKPYEVLKIPIKPYCM